MKKVTFVLGIILLTGLAMMSRQKPIQSDEELGKCVYKVKSEWGIHCEHCGVLKGYKYVFDDTYSIWLNSKCDEHLDVKCCVQEEDKTWRCFHMEDMSKQDTLHAYACKGTGKYLKWIKIHGDHSVVFPTDDEVNTDYKDL